MAEIPMATTTPLVATGQALSVIPHLVQDNKAGISVSGN
jgi:hypothetical protein